MDGVPLFAMVVGVLVLGAVVLTPRFLRWPQRVRWTVAAQAIGQAGFGPAGYPLLDLREVVLVSVDADGSDLEVGVLEVGREACDTLSLAGATRSDAEMVSMLREWCALRTPMVLYIDRAGVASLEGPAATVTNLQSVAGLTAPS